jgi:hypothetical protein
LPVGMAGHGHLVKKVEIPPPTPARIRMVLFWLLVDSGGHEQCHRSIPGRRALPVGWSWDSSIAGRWVCGRRSQSGRAPGGCWWALNLNLSLPRASEDEVAPGRSWSRIRLRTRKWLPGPTVAGLLRGETSVAGRLVLGFERCRWVWLYFLVMGKVGSPPPTPARMGMVLYWLLVDSGGHKRCRSVGLGIRALPVGVAGSPGARQLIVVSGKTARGSQP